MNRQSAIVIGASGGIGGAFADALEEEGQFDDVIRMSRSNDGADHLNLTNEQSIIDAARALQHRSIAPSLIFVATGLLHNEKQGPEKSLRELDSDWMVENYKVNAVGPALVAKHFMPLMPKDRITKFAAISARVGSISDNRLGGWYGYRASKAALNMMIRNLSIEWSRINKRSIVVALHPGTVDTALSQPFQANVPKGKLFDKDRSALQLLDVLDDLKPADSGKFFAWDGAEILP